MTKRILLTLGDLKQIVSEKFNINIDSVVNHDEENIYYSMCGGYEIFEDDTYLLQFDTEEV